MQSLIGRDVLFVLVLGIFSLDYVVALPTASRKERYQRDGRLLTIPRTKCRPLEEKRLCCGPSEEAMCILGYS